MLAGAEGIHDLAMMPVVGGADADGIDVLVGEQVGVVEVPPRLGAGLLGDERADVVFLLLVDLADGDQVDRNPLLVEAGECLHVGPEAPAARADEADPDPAVGPRHRCPGRRAGHDRASHTGRRLEERSPGHMLA